MAGKGHYWTFPFHQRKTVFSVVVIPSMWAASPPSFGPLRACQYPSMTPHTVPRDLWLPMHLPLSPQWTLGSRHSMTPRQGSLALWQNQHAAAVRLGPALLLSGQPVMGHHRQGSQKRTDAGEQASGGPTQHQPCKAECPACKVPNWGEWLALHNALGYVVSEEGQVCREGPLSWGQLCTLTWHGRRPRRGYSWRR